MIEIPHTFPTYSEYDKIPVNAENVKALAEPFTYQKEDGIVVAEHQGAHFYTIGQRKGLNIGGRPQPSFVIGLDVKNNLVYSGQTDEHSGLNRWALKIKKQDFNFVNTNYSFKDIENLKCSLRIRYRQAHQDGTVIINDDGIYVLFHKKQRGITPGQFAAIYLGDELIASGVIEH